MPKYKCQPTTQMKWKDRPRSPKRQIVYDFWCIFKSHLASFFYKFREPPKPSILQQVSSVSLGFACPRLPFSQQFLMTFSCFFCHRAWVSFLLIFVVLFWNIMQKSRILGPLHRPAGPKMIPKSATCLQIILCWAPLTHSWNRLASQRPPEAFQIDFWIDVCTLQAPFFKFF